MWLTMKLIIQQPFPEFPPFPEFEPSAPPVEALDDESSGDVFMEKTCVVCMDSQVSQVKLTTRHQLNFFL